MGNVAHLRNRVEPFAFLFWALGIVSTVLAKHLTLTAGPASLRRCTVHKACLYMVIVGSILHEDELPHPPFS